MQGEGLLQRAVASRSTSSDHERAATDLEDYIKASVCICR